MHPTLLHINVVFKVLLDSSRKTLSSDPASDTCQRRLPLGDGPYQMKKKQRLFTVTIFSDSVKITIMNFKDKTILLD